MTTKAWLNRTKYFIHQNSTTILTGAAVAGVAATAILTAKAAVNARVAAIVAESDEKDELTSKEYFQATWKIWLPPVLTGAATVACIVGANQIGLRRNAALAGAYAIAETALREYKDEVVKQIGKAKETSVTDEVAKKQIDEHPMSGQQVFITKGGDVLCYETFTGRYFRSDLETLRQLANEFNADMLNSSMFASLNDWYMVIGLDAIDMGNVLGFSVENLIKLRFTGHIADNGEPCIAMGYTEDPRADYGKL